ncbi:hypothetical protein KCU81_g9098, partial [Aureobasidium melanogenum]|uniref:Uncharacterized protein n=1 Tax=Aureobasidium melanogenum (strain CBS 110374) TaxID=1043003 RepID=A0A074W6T2_AURM1
MNGRLTLSDPSVKKLAKVSCVHERYHDALPKLQGEADWQQWSDALQHAALMAGTDAVLNGESKHPSPLDETQSTIAEWNDNIRRTAIWRARNESLLKAMRSASDIDFGEFEGLNAHHTYLNLKSKYRVSDSQQIFKLFSEDLMVGYELDTSPRMIADQLQDAFNRYNHLVGHNTEQRLPETFLKMAFLDAFDPEYNEWRNALLKDRNVLALDEGSALTFEELVDFAIAEHDRQSKEQKNSNPSKPTAPQRPSKRDISQVGEDSHSASRMYCSVPHHSTSNMSLHTNQECLLQNPRLRPKNWRPNRRDKKYLAKHPQLENYASDNESDSSLEDLAEDEDEANQAMSVGVQDATQDAVADHGLALKALDSRRWSTLAKMHWNELQSHIDSMKRTLRSNNSKKFPKHLALDRGNLSGTWLLYKYSYNPGTNGHHHMHIWEATRPRQQGYFEGELTIGRQGHSVTLAICRFSPSTQVTGRAFQTWFTDSDGQKRRGSMALWGSGKMRISAPVPFRRYGQDVLAQRNFAGVWINSPQSRGRKT